MKKLFHKLRDRKGITMTEVVIAMAMVIIITGASISVLISAVKFDATYKTQTKALNACEGAVQCLRFAKTHGTDVTDYFTLLGFEEEKAGEKYTLETAKVQKNDDGLWVVTLNGELIYEEN